MPRPNGPQFTFADLPYPRLREAYARFLVHNVGEARVAAEKTGIPHETLKQMAKSDGVGISDYVFDLVTRSPQDVYQNAHVGAALHAIRYKESETSSDRELAKREFLYAFKNRHEAMKSPHFSSMVN